MEEIEIPDGRCWCCGKKSQGFAYGYDLCPFHYDLMAKDAVTCIKYSRNINLSKIKENLENNI